MCYHLPWIYAADFVISSDAAGSANTNEGNEGSSGSTTNTLKDPFEWMKAEIKGAHAGIVWKSEDKPDAGGGHLDTQSESKNGSKQLDDRGWEDLPESSSNKVSLLTPGATEEGPLVRSK